MSGSTSTSRSPERAGGAALAIERGDERYPRRLLDLEAPPPTIWAVGELATVESPVIAIVGTRRSTAYGERVTRELAGALARANVCVISGLARGIDGTAHRAALDLSGRTAAVLGTGVELVFPAGHRAIQRRIGEVGLLLSELPPRAHAHKGTFLSRNRIIAALADVVIVVEAPHGSGALKTAEHANQLGRTIGVVPGPVDVPQSAGSNALLRDSEAQVIASPADALALVGATPPVCSTPAPDDEDQARLWRALGSGPADLDTLCSRSGLPAQRCLAAVTGLELRGAVECLLTGEIRKR